MSLFALSRPILLTALLGALACQGKPSGPTASADSKATAKPEAKAEPDTKSTPEAKGPPEPEPAAPVPTDPIAKALKSVPASVSRTYALSISEDRSELTIDPQPQPTRRAARSGGFSVRDSEAGGKIISLHGGPFRNGGWVQASFRERAPAGQLDALVKAGYDVDQRRDLLVVDGDNDPQPTLFAFSGDATKPGIVGVCSEVTIIDFGPSAGKPAPVAVRKPVLYLYPEATTTLRVGLRVDGSVTAAYPAMQGEGWTVTARPDGGLVDEATGRHHRYLFWEGTSEGFELDPAQAHCVAGDETAAFLERACDRFALTADECGDLVTYWLPEMVSNPYTVIQFVDEEVYGRYAQLNVEPAPDTVIRPFMIFERSEVPVEVGAPALPQRQRRGFTVVEWGGADLDAPAGDGVRLR